MLKLFIPKPCHEDWGSMTPNEQGRHCSVCAKTVTDFTQMSDEEVKLFFLNKKQGERTCGRFTSKQLKQITIELPANIYNIPMPLWKKFLAACLIIFGTTLFSCETNLQGKAQIENELTGVIAMPPKQQVLLGDTIMPAPTMGKPTAIDTTKKCSKTKTVTVEGEILGAIEIPPPVVQGAIAVVEPEEVKQIEPAKKDTLQKKDTANCNTQKFY
jgi:hypothetical protein